jgi:hypothetical protein
MWNISLLLRQERDLRGIQLHITGARQRDGQWLQTPP